MNPNGVKVTGERLTQNSRPGFSLATAKPSRARSRAWTDYPSTIYTSQNHKYHAERTKRAEIHLMKGEDEAFLFARRANKNRASFSPVGK